MRLESKGYIFSTDEVIYKKVDEILDFKIGDVRNIESLLPVMRNVDIIINAAALKQVPTCEYFPYEAVLTNIMGAQNIVSIIANYEISVETVVCISTDKVANYLMRNPQKRGFEYLPWWWGIIMFFIRSLPRKYASKL